MKNFLIAAVLVLACLSARGVQIRLNRATIDTEAPALRSVPLGGSGLPVSRDGRRLFLAAPEALFTEADLEVLQGLGGRIVSFIPPNAYLLNLHPGAVEELRQNFPGLYLGDYAPGYKLSQELDGAAVTLCGLGLRQTLLKLSFSLADTGYVEDVCAALEAMGGEINGSENLGVAIVRASLPASKVDQAASLPGVVWIEEEKDCCYHNICATINTKADVMNYYNWRGAGETICIADSGLGNGTKPCPHIDFTNKVMTCVRSTGNNRTSWADMENHGTHVAGTACGLGNSVIQGGQSYTRGMAPDAALYFISIDNESRQMVLPTVSDLNAAYAAGARLMNNSWGAQGHGEYDTRCQTYDNYCYTHPDFLVFFSAGNDNTSIALENNSTLSAPGTAKNIVCVGASENTGWAMNGATWRAVFGLTNAPFASDDVFVPSDGETQGMAAFSSRGPCADGRIKPDIVAPGSLLLSSSATSLTANKWMGGTSMACPVATGCAAVMRQYLRKAYGIPSPSSALMKAILLNGARQMGTGQYRNYTEIPACSPNHVNGFGHLHLVQSLSPTNGTLLLVEGHVKNGETYVVKLGKSAPGSGPVSLTLVWNDPASTPAAAKHLVNDLDLQFYDGTRTYYANAQTVPNDSVNNAEIIRLSSVPQSDRLELRITGSSVMTGEGQDFAVAINGCSGFVPEPALSSLLLLALASALRRK